MDSWRATKNFGKDVNVNLLTNFHSTRVLEVGKLLERYQADRNANSWDDAISSEIEISIEKMNRQILIKFWKNYSK